MQGINRPILLIILPMLILVMTAGLSGSSRVGSAVEKMVTVAYFYDNPCASCDTAGEFRLKLESLLGSALRDTRMEYFPYNAFQENHAKRMLEFCNAYGVPEDARKVPILFMNGLWVQGDQAVEREAAGLFVEASDTRRHPAGLPDFS